MTTPTPQTVKDHLKSLTDPQLGNLVENGLLSEIFVADGKVFFSVTVPADKANQFEGLRQQLEATVKSIPGIAGASVALTAERTPGSATNAPTPQPRAARPSRNPVEGIGAIVAVASGKGGVGKSTTTVNLALSLKSLGYNVGILDADIYGPSMPMLLGLNQKPQALESGKLKPLEAYGLKVMSIGFLIEADTPMIWRGPMVISALTQMLREVEWGELDVLVVDMPPGTGDAQLTMAQQVPLAGAVIVSTPQDLALLDARKGLNMFKKVDVPVLGIVENMSYFSCPDCGSRHEIFGHGGARQEAGRIGVPFLGEVALALDIRTSSDAGKPIVLQAPTGAHARDYGRIAQAVSEQLATSDQSTTAPQIVFE